MANTKSAIKAIRSSARKKEINLSQKQAYKTARKVVMDAVKSNDKTTAADGISAAYKRLDKAAKMKAIHPKTAARYKSRMAKAVNKLA